MIICADDLGLADDIDQAILELAGLGRIPAVSVMASLARCGATLFFAFVSRQQAAVYGIVAAIVVFYRILRVAGV